MANTALTNRLKRLQVLLDALEHRLDQGYDRTAPAALRVVKFQLLDAADEKRASELAWTLRHLLGLLEGFLRARPDCYAHPDQDKTPLWAMIREELDACARSLKPLKPGHPT